ncbi:MAG: polysaccharide lyase beta-sandwich domain-containing protein [Candidatus Sumerlaeota bacterium]|nr:polysaccharide lyase beta-sandwich domain-containing protein [Candidatus Sumerlaeota bacterium]
MAAYTAAPPFTILAQSSAVHALRHSTAGALGAIFWQAGSVDKVTVDYPCIVFLQESATTLALALSEPTHATKTIHVTIAGRLTPRQLPSGASCNAQKDKAILTLPVTGGHNYIAQFDKYIPPNSWRVY